VLQSAGPKWFAAASQSLRSNTYWANLIAKAIRISHSTFHCNKLTTVQDIQDYVSRIIWHTLYMHTVHCVIPLYRRDGPQKASVPNVLCSSWFPAPFLKTLRCVLCDVSAGDF